jgi:DNA-binding transcriptional LysR family regulator
MLDQHNWLMDLKRLRTFVTVAEHGTVSKAAEVLCITQPALSRRISALEQDLGFELFARVGRRVQLTVRGDQLLGDCRALLAQAVSLEERTHELRRGEIRGLKVAATARMIEGVLATFLHRYAQHVPGVGLALLEADASQHSQMLHSGEVDLAINVVSLEQVDDQRFASYWLPRFHIAAAFPRSRSVEATDAIDIRQLVEYPLLLPNSSFVTRKLFDAACRLAGLTAKPWMESAAAHTLLALAKAGHGVAIVPSSVHSDRRAFRSLRVTHRRQPLRIPVAVLWDRCRTLPRHAEAFAELLATHIREKFPDSRSGQRNAKRPGRKRAPTFA